MQHAAMNTYNLYILNTVFSVDIGLTAHCQWLSKVMITACIFCAKRHRNSIHGMGKNGYLQNMMCRNQKKYPIQKIYQGTSNCQSASKTIKKK